MLILGNISSSKAQPNMGPSLTPIQGLTIDQQPSITMLPGLRLVSERRQEAAANHDHDRDQQLSEPIAPSISKTGKKICAYWYHGKCNKSSSECKFLHQTEDSSNIVSWQLRRKHGPPCGLEFCPFKDSDAPKPKEAVPNANEDVLSTSGKGKKRKRRDSVVEAKTKLVPVVEHDTAKRQFPMRHWDMPRPASLKRTKIDYDDVSPVEDEKAARTCFFWYHGNCSRASDAARGLAPPCPFKHEITDPPTMVVPPPGYVHLETCDRQWCSASTVNLKKEKPVPSTNAVDRTDENKSFALDSKPKEADEICFFWYHGHCARSLDPRNRRGCGFKHELTDPPSFVQPPPGYIHRQPCGLDWCPGDAREGHSLRTAVLGQDPVVSQKGQSSTTKANDDDDDDWFLNGFD